MKKILIVIAIIFGLIIAALIIIPTFFKEDIIRLIQKEASKSINAELHIGDVSLSMFKSFPSLNVSVKDVSIAGKDRFSGDTIADMSLFEASVNVKSLIWGNEIIINKVLLKDTKFKAIIDTAGFANWDILLADNTHQSDSTQAKSDSEPGKSIKFNDIVIDNLLLHYNDYKANIYAGVENLTMKLSGNLSESNTLIDMFLSLNNITFRQQNTIWLNNTDLNWEAEIAANLKDLIFEIKKNDLSLNDLKLDLTGQVAVEKDKYKMNLHLNAPDTKFESLLALIPKDFQKHIEGLKATGDFSLQAKINGEYYKGHLPAFDAGLVINDASVRYPDLPEAIEKINLGLNINNPGGTADSTVINLKQMAFSIAGNPFSMFLKVENLNDPRLDGGAKGTINFASLKKALPLKDMILQGIINTDVIFNGKYQYIEKQQYEKFIAKGSILLQDVLFKNASFPQGISISQGNITVTPVQLNLNNLQAKVYSSDFSLKGNISNYLPYIFKNDVLKGDFSMISNQINLNEFMAATPTAPKDNKQEDKMVTGEVLEIPKNINIQLNTNINSLLFDQLTIRNIKGNIKLADAVATLGNLSMNMLKGSMTLNGKYSSLNPATPKFDFNLNISDFDINEAYNTFSFIKQSLPIAVNCNGKISSAMKFSATLDKNMDLLMNTANGSGYLDSKGILIDDNPAMNNLAAILKNDELTRISISSLRINFRVEDGNIVIEPFKTTLAGNPVTIYGSQTVNGNIDYTLSMNVSRKYFGKEINNLLNAVPGSDKIDALDIDAKITGTLDKPVVKPDLTKAINSIRKEAEKELKNKAKDEIMKGLNKLFK